MRFGALLLASLVAVDPLGWDRFGPLRWGLVSTIGLATVAASLVGTDRHARWMPTWAVAGWTMLLAGLGISTMLSEDRWHALIGTPDRHLGLMTWLLGGALFWAAGTRGGSAPRYVAMAAIAGTAIVGSYTVLELLGVEALDIDFAGDRAGGTFGQPAYLGAAMALTLPIVVGSTGLTIGGRSAAPMAWIAATLGLVALGASQARAAWVGLVVVAAAILAVRRIDLRRGRKARTLAVTGAAILVVLVVTPLGGRLWALTDVSDGVVAGRIDEWQVGARALAGADAAGLIGYGPEGYRIVFGEYVDEQYVIEYGRTAFTDRAHNGVLDVALAGGWVAAVGLAVLLLGLTRTALRAMGGEDRLQVGLAAGALAYVIQQLFLFPLAQLDPAFWVVAGLVVAGSVDSVRTPRGRLGDHSSRMIGAAAGALAIVAAIGGVLDVAADHRIEAAVSTNDLATAESAIDLRPDSIRYAFIASRLALEPGPALEHLRSGLEVSPLDPALRVEEAAVLLDRARLTDEPRHLDVARLALEDLDRTDPNHPESQLRLGVARALDGDAEGAVAAFEHAAALAPDDAAPLVSLAVLELDRNRLDGARRALDEALRRSPDDQRVLALLEEIAALQSTGRAESSENSDG